MALFVPSLAVDGPTVGAAAPSAVFTPRPRPAQTFQSSAPCAAGGWNPDGQLGNGTTTDATGPVSVVGV